MPVKDNGVNMLKCLFCNVTRFCDKVCQKGAYCKRPNLRQSEMGITLSHGSTTPQNMETSQEGERDCQVVCRATASFPANMRPSPQNTCQE